MKKYATKLAIYLCVLLIGILATPLIILAPPIGILFFLLAPTALFALPFTWIACLILWIISEKNKTRIIPVALLFTIVLSFKLGILWIFWALAFIMCAINILLLIKWWKCYKNIFLKFLLGILLLLIAINLLSTLNPFVSFFGFFGAKKLVALNAEKGNPCNACKTEKFECNNLKNDRTVCDDLKNIKNCYCCECIKNIKSCDDCFFFWDNNYTCNPINNKCGIGW